MDLDWDEGTGGREARASAYFSFLSNVIILTWRASGSLGRSERTVYNY